MERNRLFFHIDVNSAFLSWSALAHLQRGETTDLRTVPSAVGGDSSTRHGIILAKSVPAKAFRIVTGEPIVNALKKCPQLIIVSPEFDFYQKQSQALMEYLADICPLIEQASIDECYMDYGFVANDYESPVTAAERIRDEVLHRFGFTVNIGISDKKVLAKMASDFKKPNRVHTLFQSEIQDKMWQLPVSALYMCGHSAVETLRNLELLTIGDLANADLEIIKQHLKSHGKILWEFANGIDDSEVVCMPEKVKGIGNSTTLRADLTTYEEAAKVFLHLSEKVSARLRAEKVSAGNVSVEIKYSTFQSVSHQTVLDAPVASSDGLYQIAVQLFQETWNHMPIRLLGIRATRLIPDDAPRQLSIFDYTECANTQHEKQKKQKQVDEAMDRIRKKYGKDAVTRGTFLK